MLQLSEVLQAVAEHAPAVMYDDTTRNSLALAGRLGRALLASASSKTPTNSSGSGRGNGGNISSPGVISEVQRALVIATSSAICETLSSLIETPLLSGSTTSSNNSSNSNRNSNNISNSNINSNNINSRSSSDKIEAATDDDDAASASEGGFAKLTPQQKQQAAGGTMVLQQTLQSVGETLASLLQPGGHPHTLTTRNYVVVAAVDTVSAGSSGGIGRGMGSMLTQLAGASFRRRFGNEHGSGSDDSGLTRAVSITSIMYQRDLYRWSGQVTPSNTLSVTVANETVKGLSGGDLFRFEVPLKSGGGTNEYKQQQDPRLSSVCTYWDESSQSWQDRGVISLGIGMSANATLCASTHLTSFTSRAQLALTDMEFRENLVKPPTSLAIFRQQQSAIVMVTLSTIFLLLLVFEVMGRYYKKRTKTKRKNQVAAAVMRPLSEGREEQRHFGLEEYDMDRKEARMVFLASGSMGGYGAYWLHSNLTKKKHRSRCPSSATVSFFLRCYHLYLSLFLAPTAKTVTFPYRLKLLVICCNLVISGALLAMFPCGGSERECTQTLRLQNSVALSLFMAPFTKVTLQS